MEQRGSESLLVRGPIKHQGLQRQPTHHGPVTQEQKTQKMRGDMVRMRE